jgi:hypothetical protein
MTDITMVKRKRRNRRGKLKPYFEWQTITWLKEKGETKGGSRKPYIEWQTIQWSKEKGETKGEIWSLTSNDRQYNG